MRGGGSGFVLELNAIGVECFDATGDIGILETAQAVNFHAGFDGDDQFVGDFSGVRGFGNQICRANQARGVSQ